MTTSTENTQTLAEMYGDMDMSDFDNVLDAEVESFANAGASIIRPVISEGYYPCKLSALTCKYGVSTKKDPKGKPWFSIGALVTITSETARRDMKQDNNPAFRQDDKNTFLPNFPNLHPKLGFSKENNVQLWTLLGKLFAPSGAAWQEDTADGKVYKFDPNLFNRIYDEGYKALLQKLVMAVQSGERIHEDETLNRADLIPAMMAEQFLKNVSLMLKSTEELGVGVAVVSRQKKYGTEDEKENAVKKILFGEEITDTIKGDLIV